MLLSDLSDQEATGSNSHGEAAMACSHVLTPPLLLAPPPPALLLPPPPQQEEPKARKKRSQPGNPDPDAEVIALSPRTLVATNRFVCEICNKGFQRDQNLQLHRRGHNLPWKLRQRSLPAKGDGGAGAAVARKRVYVCPEPTCVHHDPSRALGDLTGIKKHFSRKHGEKRWKCERCGKGYAVHSDWKAHVKNCGTREYRCDCGILFSRKDSLITHRAFCDALAEESARLLAAANNSSNNNTSQLLTNNSNSQLFLPLSNPNPNPNPNPNSLFFLPQEASLLPPFQPSLYIDLPITTTITATAATSSSLTGEITDAMSFGLSSEGSVTFDANGHRLTRDFLGVDAGDVGNFHLPLSTTTGPGCSIATTAASRAACCATDFTRQYLGRLPPVNETWSHDF